MRPVAHAGRHKYGSGLGHWLAWSLFHDPILIAKMWCPRWHRREVIMLANCVPNQDTFLLQNTNKEKCVILTDIDEQPAAAGDDEGNGSNM